MCCFPTDFVSHSNNIQNFDFFPVFGSDDTKRASVKSLWSWRELWGKRRLWSGKRSTWQNYCTTSPLHLNPPRQNVYPWTNHQQGKKSTSSGQYISELTCESRFYKLPVAAKVFWVFTIETFHLNLFRISLFPAEIIKQIWPCHVLWPSLAIFSLNFSRSLFESISKSPVRFIHPLKRTLGNVRHMGWISLRLSQNRTYFFSSTF